MAEKCKDASPSGYGSLTLRAPARPLLRPELALQPNRLDVQLSAVEFLGYGRAGHPQFRIHFSPDSLYLLNSLIRDAAGRSIQMLVYGRLLTTIFAGPPLTFTHFTATVADAALAGMLHAVALGVVRLPSGTLTSA